jgi:hypothetical protein
MGDEPIPNSLETSTVSQKSENESPTQTADKLSHLSIGSRKISLESNGSHQTNSPSTSTSNCYVRSRPNREILVPPTQDEYVS